MISLDYWELRRRGDEHVVWAGRWASLCRWLEDAPNAHDTHEWARPPSCGCCGGKAWLDKPMVLTEVEPMVWRCEKHVGRLPCCIEGCGKTFAMKGDDSYQGIVMCGRHWRMAPKRMRDLESLIRKRAKRRGWTRRLIRQHDWIWQRARRAIDRGGEFDMTEINKMFGWEE